MTKTQDPTAEEMRAFLATLPSDGENVEFETEEAIYWFASYYHSGQSSNLYSALSMSEYRPGFFTAHPEHGSLSETYMYALISEFTS